MEKKLKNIQTFEQHTDKNLNISDVIERLIQDEAIKYVDKYEWDSMKEQGQAYSAFLSGCRYILLNKDKF